eukprot:SAG11_NODE_697_length_7684_cov_8.250231_2_plen_132_part_00
MTYDEFLGAVLIPPAYRTPGTIGNGEQDEQYYRVRYARYGVRRTAVRRTIASLAGLPHESKLSEPMMLANNAELGLDALPAATVLAGGTVAAVGRSHRTNRYQLLSSLLALDFSKRLGGKFLTTAVICNRV